VKWFRGCSISGRPARAGKWNTTTSDIILLILSAKGSFDPKRRPGTPASRSDHRYAGRSARGVRSVAGRNTGWHKVHSGLKSEGTAFSFEPSRGVDTATREGAARRRIRWSGPRARGTRGDPKSGVGSLWACRRGIAARRLLMEDRAWWGVWLGRHIC